MDCRFVDQTNEQLLLLFYHLLEREQCSIYFALRIVQCPRRGRKVHSFLCSSIIIYSTVPSYCTVL